MAYNVSDAAGDNKVLVQTPPASPQKVVEGTLVKLQIGALPERPAVPDDVKAINELKADLDGKLDRMSLAIEGLVKELQETRARYDAVAKQKA